MDIIVLTLAETECYHSRADFDAELKAMLGDACGTVWRSRPHGSVHDTLCANGISCFKQKNKSKRSQKAKTRRAAIAPVYPKTLSSLGGPAR